MGPALFVMAILGCGEGEAACQPVQIADTRYESREACLAATNNMLASYSNLDFPVVLAECRAASAVAGSIRGADVALPEPDRRPSAWND
jgi:hypothetical protein